MGLGGALACLAYALNTGRFWRITDADSPKSNSGWRLFLGLNAGAGAFITGAYIHSLGKVPIWAPFLISLVTYAVFLTALRKV